MEYYEEGEESEPGGRGALSFFSTTTGPPKL
jgi:hypothetical protein